VKINIIKGRNIVGKTTLIKNMLGYELDERYKYSTDLHKKYFSIINNKYLVLEMNYQSKITKADGLIVRFYLNPKCSKCKEINKLYKKFKTQNKKLLEKEENLKKSDEYQKIFKEYIDKSSKIIDQIKEIESRMKIIKDKSKIDFDDDYKWNHYTDEQMSENKWWDYYDLQTEVKRLEKDQKEILDEADYYRREARRLGGKQGYTQLKEAVEFNSWKFLSDLIKHSAEERISVWITIIDKLCLIPFFNDIKAIRIYNLFIDKLEESWIIAELEQKFDRFVSFNPPIKSRLEFPQNINKIFVESNSLDDRVIIQPTLIKI